MLDIIVQKSIKAVKAEQEAKEIRSVLCVPIWSQAKLIGILMMMNKKTHEPFNVDDLRLLSIIAAQSGQLIRNSQLQEKAMEKKRLEFELSLARRIQTNLLPKTAPITPHLDIASYFNPSAHLQFNYLTRFLRDQPFPAFSNMDLYPDSSGRSCCGLLTAG